MCKGGVSAVSVIILSHLKQNNSKIVLLPYFCLRFIGFSVKNGGN